MTALDTMRKEHIKILRMQSECITESGFVINDRRNDYNVLCKKERQVRDGIQLLEELKQRSINVQNHSRTKNKR